MTRYIVLLSAAILLAGCASPAQPPGTRSDTQIPISVNSPPITDATVSPETPLQPAEYLFPWVPLYPAATTSGVLPDQRAQVQVKDEAVAKVLAWYQAELVTVGWKAEQTGLPPDKVMLFSREGRYLSLSGYDSPHDRGSMVWLHLRSTREVTREEAIVIAKNAHRGQGEWTATLLRDVEMERYGADVRHPVWMIEASPGNDAVWVDAITAEPFRIRQ